MILFPTVFVVFWTLSMALLGGAAYFGYVMHAPGHGHYLMLHMLAGLLAAFTNALLHTAVMMHVVGTGRSIKLARARTNTARDMQDADKEDAVVVAVTRDGNIFIGNTQVQKADLSGQVKDRISNRVDKVVYLKSDARAKYGDVVAVVDEIRSAGVDQLGLLTERNERTGQPPPPPPNGD